jgi:hypothetical protein
MPEPEGDLTQIGREELSEFARVLPVGEGLEERIRESRIGTELWLPFLLLAAVLAGSEMWLARAGKEAEPPR